VRADGRYGQSGPQNFSQQLAASGSAPKLRQHLHVRRVKSHFGIFYIDIFHKNVGRIFIP
jgi:hypothetical protein